MNSITYMNHECKIDCCSFYSLFPCGESICRLLSCLQFPGDLVIQTLFLFNCFRIHRANPSASDHCTALNKSLNCPREILTVFLPCRGTLKKFIIVELVYFGRLSNMCTIYSSELYFNSVLKPTYFEHPAKNFLY